jgi:hypothetical protein
MWVWGLSRYTMVSYSPDVIKDFGRFTKFQNTNKCCSCSSTALNIP